MGFSITVFILIFLFALVNIFIEKMSPAIEDLFIYLLFFACAVLFYFGLVELKIVPRIVISTICACAITWFSIIESKKIRAMRKRDIAQGKEKLQQAIQKISNKRKDEKSSNRDKGFRK